MFLWFGHLQVNLFVRLYRLLLWWKCSDNMDVLRAYLNSLSFLLSVIKSCGNTMSTLWHVAVCQKGILGLSCTSRHSITNALSVHATFIFCTILMWIDVCANWWVHMFQTMTAYKQPFDFFFFICKLLIGYQISEEPVWP